MKTQIRLHKLGRGTCLCIRRKVFKAGGRRLIVEDLINLSKPLRSSRILMVAGTNVYYSEVPLLPFSHRLLCYRYCADVLKKRESSFYRHALVLGLGGGAVPRYLLETCPSLSVDVVDYSSKIISVCKKYFLHKWEGSDRLHFYCKDAREYTSPGYQYQFIFCDLFDGDDLVPFVCDPDFAARVLDMISDRGILLINCGWTDHLQKVQETYQSAYTRLRMTDEKPRQIEIVLENRQN